MAWLKRTLDVIAAAAAAWLLWERVAMPMYQLLHRGVRPHGSLTEDPDFYYGLIAVGMWRFGQAGGMALSIIGLACAFSSVLGFEVSLQSRVRARSWFWYGTTFWFFLELLGRFQVQRWYGRQGVPFPAFSFIQDFAPSFAWLCGVWLATAPAIRSGRGIYSWLGSR